MRAFRPFPKQDVIEALADVKAVAVMDRSHSFGAYGGPIFHEVRHILYDSPTHPYVVNYIYGLGGRDMPQHRIHQIYKDLQEIVHTKRVEKAVQFTGRIHIISDRVGQLGLDRGKAILVVGYQI